MKPVINGENDNHMYTKILHSALSAVLKTIMVVLFIIIVPAFIFVIFLIRGVLPRTSERLLNNQTGKNIVIQFTTSGFLNGKYNIKGYIDDEKNNKGLEVFSSDYPIVLYRVVDKKFTFFVYSANTKNIVRREFNICTVCFLEPSKYYSMIDAKNSMINAKDSSIKMLTFDD